ncbi:MAG: hypothetical protein QMD53_07015 [Actinomycetota bacterium]|nr:hypothetical protein [Actinomycetota bacterium]
MKSNITEKINFLFATKLSPDGDEYKYEEVTRGTGGMVSASYVWNLRKGKKDNPSREKIEALAKFFDVAPSCIIGGEGAKRDYKVDNRIDKILADPLVREIALGTLNLSDDAKELILTMVKKAGELE